MKVELEKTFPMPGSADVAWEFLQNIEAVAGCMPGAKITERLPDGGYKGTVTVRVGPATMSFRGEVEVQRHRPGHALAASGLARAPTPPGPPARRWISRPRIEAVADGSSNLVGKSEVTMSGKAAAFGGRMMNSVADQILQAVRRQLRGAGGSAARRQRCALRRHRRCATSAATAAFSVGRRPDRTGSPTS